MRAVMIELSMDRFGSFVGKASVTARSGCISSAAAKSKIGDASRPTANTTAAFSVGFVVALVYLYQAATTKAAAPE